LFALLIAALGAMLLAVRFVDRRPLSAFGVGFLPYWSRHLGAGLMLAAGMLGALVAGCYAFGYVSIRWTARQVPASTLLATLGLLLLAAAVEELVFRGYFQKQFEALTRSQWAALSMQGAIFGIAHGYQGFGATVAITFYGVLFGSLAIRRGSLRPGMIAHGATNILAGVFGI